MRFTRFLSAIILLISIASSQIKIACIGDSNTESAGLNPDISYPTVLQTMLGSDYLVENYGIAGTTLLSKGDNPYIGKWAFNAARFWIPDVVIIILGTNDSSPENWIPYGDEFKENYITMINKFREISDPNFLLCFPPPLFDNEYANAVIRDEIIPIIKDVADATGTRSVNLYTPLLDRAYFPDGTHANAEGFKKIAEILTQQIRLVLNDTPPAVPEGLEATANENSIDLRWNSVKDSDIASYVLYSGLESGNLNYLLNVIHPGTTYTHVELDPGREYFYRVSAMDQSGNQSARSNVVSAIIPNIEEEEEEEGMDEVEDGGTDDEDDVEEDDEEEEKDDVQIPEIPAEFNLKQNYPNPFNPTTMITYQLPEDSHVQITIFSLRGDLVRRLVNRIEDRGFHNVRWDSKDEHGQPVSGGIYFYRLSAGAYTRTMKMVVLK
ncbi:MAG: GDSL-type esterase/lipase family protein [Candidatus Neomarinimicrobiota bacterium]